MKLLSVQQYKAQMASVLSSSAIGSLNRDTESLVDALAVCRTVFDPRLTRSIDYFQAQLMQLKPHEQDGARIDFDTAFKLRRKFFTMGKCMGEISVVLNAVLNEKIGETLRDMGNTLDDTFTELCIRDNQHHESMRVFREGKSPGLTFVNWNIEFADSSKYFTEPCPELTSFTRIHIRHPNVDIEHPLSTPLQTVADLVLQIHNLTEQSKTAKQMTGIGCDINELEVDPKSPHCLVVFIKSAI